MMEYEDHVFTDDLREPVNLIHWAMSLVTWDGMLAAVMILAPSILKWCWPRDLNAQDLASTMLLIAALCLRVIVGRRHIARNHCRELTRGAQRFILYVMAMFLLLIDLMLIEGERMRGNDASSIVVTAAIYVVCMSFVLYPGRKPVARSQF